MARMALFAGLVVDENDNAVEVAYVGDEAMYVVNDAGFRRHIPTEQIDLQVLQAMGSQIEGNEDLLSREAAKMLGADDPFSKAMIENQLKNIDQQFEALMNTGIPEEMRAYMGMMGFRIVINVHGEIVELHQPGAAPPPGEEE